MCHGFVAKFAAADGTLEWEKKFDDLGAAFWIKLDAADDALYFTATTTYGGRSSYDSKQVRWPLVPPSLCSGGGGLTKRPS